jgi:hypothetical protein
MVFLATQGRVVCKTDVIFASNIGQPGFYASLRRNLTCVWRQIGDWERHSMSAQCRAAKIKVLILQ